jgi:hypothetical protein
LSANDMLPHLSAPSRGGTETSSSPGATAGSSAAITIELSCLDCGRPIADIQAPQSPPDVAAVLLRLPWRRLRCATCGGVPVVTDLILRRRQGFPLDWASDCPRRGRPPGGSSKPTAEAAHGNEDDFPEDHARCEHVRSIRGCE